MIFPTIGMDFPTVGRFFPIVSNMKLSILAMNGTLKCNFCDVRRVKTADLRRCRFVVIASLRVRLSLTMTRSGLFTICP